MEARTFLVVAAYCQPTEDIKAEHTRHEEVELVVTGSNLCDQKSARDTCFIWQDPLNQTSDKHHVSH